MGKYLATAINSVKKNLVYRANSFILIISVFFSFLVLFYFWNSIYRQGNQIGSYSLQEIVSYYIMMTIFELLVVGDNTAWSVGEEIKSGQITANILRPIRYLEYKFSQSMGSLFFRVALFALPIIGACFLLRDYFVFPHAKLVYLIFGLSAVISYALYFLVYFIVGIISFWTIDSYGFFFAAFVMIHFMQGGLLPLDLLPTWFVKIGDFLPFKYLFFVPVGIITERVSLNYWLLIIPFFWCLALYFLANFIYQKGLKKYEGYGI